MKRIYSGISVTIFGIALIIASFIWEYFILIYGIPIFIIGIVILLNRREDKIEELKYKKGGKKIKK
ncbi:MAG: hypothetical protein Q8Q04_00045 [archaeon]|nr:hypothetical protein [archaeon]